MKNKTVIIKFIFIISFFYCSKDILDPDIIHSPGLAESPWPMFHHDRHYTGRSPYKGPKSGKIKWKYKAGSTIGLSPVIGEDGTIYFGSRDKYFYAVNTNGILKWKFKTEGAIFSPPSLSSDGTLYFGSQDGYLYALNDDGSLKWKFLLEGNYTANSPILGEDSIIYILSNRRRNLYALNPDGTLKWNFEVEPSEGQYPIPEPTIYNNSLLVGYLHKYIACIDKEAEIVKWKIKVVIDQMDGFSLAEIVVDPDDNFYITTSKRLLKYNNRRELQWETEIFNCGATPALGRDRTLYIPAQGQFHAVSPLGKVKWSFVTGGNDTSSPLIDADENIYFGSVTGYVYALKSDGSVLWEIDTRSAIIGSPALDDNRTLYIGDNDGYLYAIH